MSNMEYIRMSDYCSSVRDGTHDTPKPTSEGKPLVTSKAINNNRIDFNQTYNISLEDFDKINKRSLVEKWDILMSMIGTVGRLFLVREEPDYAIKNVALFKIGDEKKAKWLYYYLSLKEVQDYFHAIAAGTSQHFIPLNQLRKLKIHNYNENSEKIINILSSYDELIENNEKQIKTLEEMAEKLYKEWFVHFRFPGYEKVDFHEGIPMGWKRARLRDIAKDIGKSFNKDNRDLYSYYVPIDCIPNKSMVLSDYEDVSNAESSLQTFKKNDILFGAMRPYFHKVLYSPIDGITRKTCFVINAKNRSYTEFLYCLLYQKSSVDYATTVSVGSTMPYVRWEDFARMNIVLPDENIVKEFANQVDPILKRLQNFFFENEKLKKQRDLLLPRLMSGKLEI